MRPLDADHLIAGAGLLGLALADHLLRRGAKKVILLEKESDPVRRMQGFGGLALCTGLPAYRELEARGTLLLEEWKDYLEVDPQYRRCGSIQIPALLESEVGERVSGATLRERAPLLACAEEDEGVSFSSDGFVDESAVRSALLSQVRRRGGHLVMNCALEGLAATSDGIRYRAASREGNARHVYLTAGPGNRRLWRGLEQEELPASAWHTVSLAVPAGMPSILRLDEEGASGSVAADNGLGTLSISLSAAAVEADEVLSVDWSLFESFRARLRTRMSILSQAHIQRGRADLCLDLDARAPGILTGPDPRILAAGAVGLHHLPLKLGLAERLAERVLASCSAP